MKTNKFILLLYLGIIILFFYRFFFLGLLPIPADTIVGLYHPYRDAYASSNPRGVTYKNFLITDPVRQQYPWRELAISLFKQGKLPIWNPYTFSGTPLLANFQTAAFYPLNIVFFVLPFMYGWSMLVFLQPFLAGVFMFYYLSYLRFKKEAAILGGITFALSGFSVAWMEWNTIMHTALWLPLILLAKEQLLAKRTWKWIGILIFSEVSMFLAGHLQTFFYAFILSSIYLLIRFFQLQREKKLENTWEKVSTFIFTGSIFVILTAVQWIPTLQFILLSARSLDQANWATSEGWFIPWQHLVQFIAPDFFGNPATLNYWGVWNYGELVGYIGIIPLLFAIYAILFRRDRKTLFACFLLLISFVFALPTTVAKIPYLLQIPLLASTQPTRMLFIIDFALAFLAACGFDLYICQRKKIYLPLTVLGGVLLVLWLFVLKAIPSEVSVEDLLVAKRNLLLPTALVTSSLVLLLPQILKKSKYVSQVVVLFVIVLTLFDLFRFFDKFTSFSPKEYLYPTTKTITFLQKQPKPFRIMSLDPRILPPNFTSIYRIETIEGYDPLYLQRYGEYIISSERPYYDISGPFGFNRIITPHNYNAPQKELLQIKYILSIDELHEAGLKKVFEEGQTKVYENTAPILPRAFFVERILSANSRQKSIEKLTYAIRTQEAVIENAENNMLTNKFTKGKIVSSSYSPNKIIFHTETPSIGFLVLSETYYPSWRVLIDGKPDKIYRTDYNFRGIVVPSGKHTITFFVSLF